MEDGCSMRSLTIFIYCTLAVAQWTPVAKSGLGPFSEVALARTSDGVLHAAWRQQGDDGKWSLWYASRGQASETAIRGWSALSDPALAAGADGALYLIFGGVRGEGPREAAWNQGSLYRAVRAPGDTEFVLEEKEHSRSRTAYAGPLGLSVAHDGAIWIGWPANAEYVVQPGFDRPTYFDAAGGDCCVYMGQLAADAATGELWAAWYASAGAHRGLMLRRATPDLGPLLIVPGTTGVYFAETQVREPDQQLAFSGRSDGPGVWLAWCQGYPTCTEIRLWQPGPAAPITLARGVGLKGPALARAPEGRLWVAWVEGGRVAAVRSNREMTRFSKPVTVPAPVSSAKIYAEASEGPLDVFIHTGAALFQSRITPPSEVDTPVRVTRY